MKNKLVMLFSSWQKVLKSPNSGNYLLEKCYLVFTMGTKIIKSISE